jgi:hypothetical protein
MYHIVGDDGCLQPLFLHDKLTGKYKIRVKGWQEYNDPMAYQQVGVLESV